MESQAIQTLSASIAANRPAALVTVIANSGSSPGKTGAMMTVLADGTISGTVGGGNLEHQAMKEALSCLDTGENREVSYSLTRGGKLAMSCGGELRLFIKVFNPLPQLVIVGAGHIGYELYQLGQHQGFKITVIDDRADMVTEHRFPEARCICSDNLPKALTELPVSAECYITIATRSHDMDRLALTSVAGSDAAYIGMIGSRSKVRSTLKYLLEQGIPKEKIAAIYAPMGLNIASVQPKEIAVSIISEILLVKNKGSLDHMRTIKRTDIL